MYVSPDDLGDGSPAPEPVAAAWLVANVDTGDVVASHGEDVVNSPASVQKLLTALALVDELPDKQKKYRASQDDVTIDGTRVGLLYDNDYTIDTLFHAMLMSSANDAAHALGEAVGGQHAALELMRAKAQQLGMDSTKVGTTSGLDAPGQGTTVVDLLKLTHAFLDNDYLMRIVQTENMEFPGGFDHDKNTLVKGFQIQNHTKMVGRVDGALGLKNGYTQAARGSFVGVAKRGGTTYAAIVLRAENKTREADTDLLNWAFNQKDPRVLHTVSYATPTPTEGAGGTEGATTSANPANRATEATSPPTQSVAQVPALLSAGVPVILVLAAGGAYVVMRRRGKH